MVGAASAEAAPGFQIGSCMRMSGAESPGKVCCCSCCCRSAGGTVCRVGPSADDVKMRSMGVPLAE